MFSSARRRWLMLALALLAAYYALRRYYWGAAFLKQFPDLPVLPDWAAAGLLWLGIIMCLAGSAICSGLTLGLFSLSKLQLELAVQKGSAPASRVLGLRQDANTLLGTLLWSNVAVNVCLTLLVDVALPGIPGFLFSVFGITIFGEILPQAYFSRNPLKTGSLLTPVVRVMKIATYPITKPTGWLLDRLVGPEALRLFREQDVRLLIEMHIQSPQTDITALEGNMAKKAFTIDDERVIREGENIDPDSIIKLDFIGEQPQFPELKPDRSDPFVQRLYNCRKKWAILVDQIGRPRLVLEVDALLCDIFCAEGVDPAVHYHAPVITENPNTVLGDLLRKLKVKPEHPGDNVIDNDVILFWPQPPSQEARKIITLADISGYLLEGLVVEE